MGWGEGWDVFIVVLVVFVVVIAARKISREVGKLFIGEEYVLDYVLVGDVRDVCNVYIFGSPFFECIVFRACIPNAWIVVEV